MHQRFWLRCIIKLRCFVFFLSLSTIVSGYYLQSRCKRFLLRSSTVILFHPIINFLHFTYISLLNATYHLVILLPHYMFRPRCCLFSLRFWWFSSICREKYQSSAVSLEPSINTFNIICETVIMYHAGRPKYHWEKRKNCIRRYKDAILVINIYRGNFEYARSSP
jgi:hypothetical protein